LCYALYCQHEIEPPALDNVDRGILQMLQDDARSNSPRDVADAIGVSPNTVRNRIEKLYSDEGLVRDTCGECSSDSTNYCRFRSKLLDTGGTACGTYIADHR